MDMNATYVHCPQCNDLDRHFSEGDNPKGSWFCQPCLEIYPCVDFKEPEISDKWVAQILGTEISVVQMKDLHGRISCGWFSETKILIAEVQAYANSSEVSPVVEKIMQTAKEEAIDRNNLQSQ